jgi:hypothetical protein
MVEQELDRPLWGAEAIAREINRAPRATYHLLENGYLDADRVGGRWVSTPRRLREQFAGKSGKFSTYVTEAPVPVADGDDRSTSEVER